MDRRIEQTRGDKRADGEKDDEEDNEGRSHSE